MFWRPRISGSEIYNIHLLQRYKSRPAVNTYHKFQHLFCLCAIQCAMRKLDKLNWAKLQNTPPLICISLNKNSIYCYIPHSSKHTDTCIGWAGVFCNRSLNWTVIQTMKTGMNLVNSCWQWPSWSTLFGIKQPFMCIFKTKQPAQSTQLGYPKHSSNMQCYT